MMSSTWTGAAAWRNVPHVVATGNSRLVTRNVDRADQHHGPQRAVAGLPRQRQQADDRERDAQEEQHVEDVVGQALDAHLEEPRRAHGEVARQGGRVVPGEDVEAR